MAEKNQYVFARYLYNPNVLKVVRGRKIKITKKQMYLQLWIVYVVLECDGMIENGVYKREYRGEKGSQIFKWTWARLEKHKRDTK